MNEPLTRPRSSTTDFGQLLGLENVFLGLISGLVLSALALGLGRFSQQRRATAEILALGAGERVHFSGWVCECVEFEVAQICDATLKFPGRPLRFQRLLRLQGRLPKQAKVGTHWQGMGQLKTSAPFKNASSFGLLARVPSARISVTAIQAMDAPERFLMAWWLRQRVREWLGQRLSNFPGLLALSNATWLGDDSLLIPDFLFWNRSAGLSHALAVSGQHILILSTIFYVLTRCLAALVVACFALPVGKSLRLVCDLHLPAAALFLALVCPEEGSVWRAAVAVGILVCVKHRAWSTSRLQLFSTSLAVALLQQPESGSDWGFQLSGAGAFLLLVWMGDTGTRGWLRAYLALCLFIPLFALPLQLHFFARADAWALVHAVSFTWIWGVFWIPVGFLAPFASFLLPLGVIESGWMEFQRCVARGVTLSLPLVRPLFFESIGGRFCCFGPGFASPHHALILEEKACQINKIGHL